MPKRSSAVWTVGIAFLLAAIAYAHNNIFIDFADEGFLWYGARHVLTGQVPILDFQAYDPGRYYWCASVMSVFGKGLMPLRLAAGLFQFLGLSLGLLALRRAVKQPAALFGAGLLAVFFMLVPCRYFNASLPLIALFFAVRLTEKPSARRHLAAGICTGLIAFIAVNHGFYVFLAFISLMLYLDAKKCTKAAPVKCLYFLAGIGIGSIPWLILFVAVPHFWASLLERLAVLGSGFGAGKMNVSLPMVWPWSVSWAEISRSLPNFQARALEYTNRFSIGVLFIVVIVYYLVSVLSVIRLKNIRKGPQALFISSVFVGFFYLGHVFARADLVYLGEGIFPVLAGLLAAPAFLESAARKRIAAGMLALFVAAGFLSAGLRSTILFKIMVPKEGMTWVSVGKDRIWLMLPDAEYVDNVKKLVSKYVKPEEPILLAPLLTTFYGLLDKESPVYELYFHFAPTRRTEEMEIRQLQEKNVRWAIVADLWIDGHKEQSMSYSHPLLWKYLTENFEFVSNQGLRPGYSLLRIKA